MYRPEFLYLEDHSLMLVNTTCYRQLDLMSIYIIADSW